MKVKRTTAIINKDYKSIMNNFFTKIKYWLNNYRTRKQNKLKKIIILKNIKIVNLQISKRNQKSSLECI